MDVTRHAGAIGPATVGLILGAVALFTAEAAAAPPIVCVRNLTGAEIEVVAGIQGDRPGKPGIYLGAARARGGACRYADIDGEMNVSIRRGLRADPPGEQYGEIATASGGWMACPAQSSANGWYVYAVRRGRSGLVCKPGGGTRGLEGPGDYE